MEGAVMAWITVRFEPPISADARNLLVQIPGVRIKGAWFSCPDHALPIVREMAHALGHAIIPSGKIVTPTITRIPLLREWVPKFMTSYQREGVAHALVEWAASNQSGMLVWAAGSGKTLGGIAWACAAGAQSRTVVITKSAVRLQYRDEIERFAEVTAEALDGQKPSALPSSGFVVIGYDVLPYWAHEIERWKPDSVIFDESHRVKSHKRFDAIVAKPSGRPMVTRGGGDVFAESDGAPVVATITPAEPEVTFKLKGNQSAAAFIVSRAAKRRLATTATPVRDRVRDLWAQLDLVRPAEFGSYYGPRGGRAGFVFRYCGARDGSFGGIDDSGATNLEELKSRIRSVCHYVPFSIANRELPPKRRRVALVRVAEQNRGGAIAADIKRAARSGQRAALIEARLREVASRKRNRIGDLVAQAIENDQKVIIFTGRRRDCDELEAEILSRVDGINGLAWITGSDDPKVPVWTAHGGHADTARRQIQKDYMAAPGPAVLIGTSEAWGEGLDLQDTDLLLVAMLPYTPGQVIQIEGRVARLGQRRPVEIVYLIAESSIDEHVAQILLRKLPAVEKATDTEEVRGIAHELAGADDETLIAELAAAIGGAA